MIQAVPICSIFEGTSSVLANENKPLSHLKDLSQFEHNDGSIDIEIGEAKVERHIQVILFDAI